MAADTDTKRERNSISALITRRTFAVSASLIVLASILITVGLYVYLGSNVNEELSDEAESLSLVLDEKIEEGSQEEAGTIARSVLSSDAIVIDADIRVTLIDPDGTVLYDSQYDASELENHSDRPEFVEAVETGEGVSGRYSETLDEETIYYAVQLSDGSVVRLAIVQSSALGLILNFIPVIIAIVLVCVLVSYLMGSRTARKLSDSMTGLDLEHPGDNPDAPVELVPMLEQLDEQKRKLDEQDAERRRFTSNASHELKTPLTVISGYAEIISSGIAKPEDVEEFSGIIYDESKRMKAIVDDLLTLNRLDDMDMAPQTLDMDQDVPLDEVASNAVDRLRPAAENHDLKMWLNVPSQNGSGMVMVKGNRQLLEELARNIVENAVRYNVDGGYVRVTVSRDGYGRPLLSVADSGIGIPPDQRKKIFERFYCVDEGRSRATGGSGLGLAIVKHTAELHDAQITVKSNFPRGSIFDVTFPDPANAGAGGDEPRKLIVAESD